MAAVGKAHTHHGIAWLQQGKLHCSVSLRAGVGLYVGKFRAEQLFRPLNAKAFHLIYKFTAAVISLAGQALGILIR